MAPKKKGNKSNNKGDGDGCAENRIRLSEVARQVPASEIDRITGRLPPTQVNLNFIKTLERIPGSIPAPTHPQFDLKGLGEIKPTWYVDELRKRPFPEADPRHAALISSEPSDFSLEGQPKSYGRFSTQRPTMPGGFGEILTVFSKEVVRYQVQGIPMTNLFSAIFFRELVRMRGISFRDQLKHDIQLEELRKEREALTKAKLYRGRTGVRHLTNAHQHKDFAALETNFESTSSSSYSSSSSSSYTSTSSSSSTLAQAGGGGIKEESDEEGKEEGQKANDGGDDDGLSEGAVSKKSSSTASEGGVGAGERDAVAKEFRDVLAAKKEIQSQYDPHNEYGIPKAKTVVTPGTLKKEDPIASLICTRETCEGVTCNFCKQSNCSGDCVDAKSKTQQQQQQDQQRAKKPGKRCKKCGHAIVPKPTMKELGICTPDTCGEDLVCGGECCAACEGIPPQCEVDTCGETRDCFGRIIGGKEDEEDQAVDESLAMGEHICRTSTCGNRLTDNDEKDDEQKKKDSKTSCCKICSKPKPTKCHPGICGDPEEYTCDDCLRGLCCARNDDVKCNTCGEMGGGNRACGDCGNGSPGGPILDQVICGKTVCGKEVECVECGGVLCKDGVCGSDGVDKKQKKGGGNGEAEDEKKPRCKKCLKKRLLAAECVKKTCAVCSGEPSKDGRVPSCCKKCVRKESVEDLDKKISASEIPPNIKRLVKHGWDVDDPMHPPGNDEEDSAYEEDENLATTGSASKEDVEGGGGKGGSGGGGSGPRPVVDPYCVPGNGCRNRCGICTDCTTSKSKNNNSNFGDNNNNNVGLPQRARGLKTPRAPIGNGDDGANLAACNVSANCDAQRGGVTCTLAECGKTTLCHKCHGGRDDKPEACPVCHPPRLTCGPGVCQVLVDCGDCCEPTPEFKAAFPKIAYSGVGPFQLAVCAPIAGKIAAKKLGLECNFPSPQLEEKVDDRWFEPDAEAERRRLEQLRLKQLAARENNFTSERLFGRRFSGAACGVAEWRDELQGDIMAGGAGQPSKSASTSSPSDVATISNDVDSSAKTVKPKYDSLTSTKDGSSGGGKGKEAGSTEENGQGSTTEGGSGRGEEQPEAGQPEAESAGGSNGVIEDGGDAEVKSVVDGEGVEEPNGDEGGVAAEDAASSEEEAPAAGGEEEGGGEE